MLKTSKQAGLLFIATDLSDAEVTLASMPLGDALAPLPPADSTPENPAGLPPAEQTRWFTENVQPHEGKLRGYLRRIVDVGEVDDVVQETYLRLLKVRAVREIASPSGLLFATARNAVRDIFRRRAVAKTTSVAETDCSRVFDDGPGVSEMVGRKQEVELLDAAIRALPDRCRTVLILRKYENLSHREIAARMGISPHTVEAQLTKAVTRIEEYFARHGLTSG